MSLTVVLSIGQSRSPEKRGLEDAILDAAKQWPDAQVVAIPNLYDLVADGPSVNQLRQVNGPIVILSWMYERATHWVLNRLGVCGQLVPTELSEQEDDVEEPNNESAQTNIADGKSDRIIHCIDLKANQDAQAIAVELRRLVDWHLANSSAASNEVTVATSPKPQELTLASLFMGSPESDSLADSASSEFTAATEAFRQVNEHPTRRWYPVIDFSRCTNCMECIDFCLFGVYGVDASEKILVEQPDNCRKGCPACSRVCPANAIIFPQHKTPAIAGSASGDTSFKIDLSKLFGAPDSEEDAAATAARERDEQLILAGRAAVGMPANESSQIPTRTSSSTIRSEWSANKAAANHLDSLLDQLDELDL